MKLSIKRKLEGFLALLLTFSMIMCGQAVTFVKADGENPNGSDGIVVAFSDGAVSGNAISYAVKEQSVTVTVEGGVISDSSITVPRGNEGSITFTLSGNYDPDTMEVRVYADDGFRTTLAVTDSSTSLADKTNEGGLPDFIKLIIVPKGNPGGDGPVQPGPDEPGGNGASHQFPYPDQYTSQMSVTGDAEFYINGVSGQDRQYDETTHMDIVTQKTSVTYPYDINSENVEFEFETLINERYTGIKINGVDYSSYIPGYTSEENPKTDSEIEAEVLAAIDSNGNNQTTSVILSSVPRADSYIIEVSRKIITTEDSVYWPVGNFLWTSQEEETGGGDNGADQEFRESDCIKGGKIQLVAVKYDGITYSDETGSEYPLTGETGLLGSKCYYAWDECVDFQGNLTGDGGAVFPYGTELTIKLIPDYGKQLVAFGVNGGVFTCGESVSTYTFTVARGNFHLNARFEDVADVVSADGSKEVSGGSITLGANEIDMGSAVLTVSDASVTEEEKAAFSNSVDGYTVDSYLDLNLNQVVYKGSTTDFWENDMSTLNSDATITLELNNVAEGSDIEIIHQKHDGTYEVLPATYDAVTNTVTFSTNSFSKYAIAYADSKSTEEDITYGDVDGEPGITLGDAQLVLKLALKIVPHETLNRNQLLAADVTGNGNGIDLSDAQAILKRALRISVIFDNEK